jgi:hypothetical protein
LVLFGLFKTGLQELGKCTKPGVDVIITIFCDFRQFLAKKLTFFPKTNLMIKILRDSALF